MTGQSTTSAPHSCIHVPLAAKGDVFPVHLTNATAKSLLDEFEHLLADGQGFAAATVNLDHVVKLRQSEQFRDAYSSHSHVVADGNPIVWLARLSGGEVELVPGSELIWPVAELAARTGVPLGFFGATDESLDAASTAMRMRFPDLQIPDCIAPPYGFDPAGEQADEFIARMGRSPARFWLLALGAPKQEIFAARAWNALPGKGFLSIGAGLDFIAGQQVRAPKVVQSLAMEWFWRMAGSPARLGPRYARCAAALPALTGAAMRQRRAR